MLDLEFRPYGETGILIQNLERSRQSQLRGILRQSAPTGLVEFIEGYDTVLLDFEKPIGGVVLEVWLESLELSVHSSTPPPVCHQIPVIYDGEDLPAVAEQIGVSEAELIEIHTKPTYVVRMMGFSPGFPYLDGLDPRLHLPRRSNPRTRIRAGSVAIGGSHAGIYSVNSPGGWHILGRTETPLFRPVASKAPEASPRDIFLLEIGDEIKFLPA